MCGTFLVYRSTDIGYWVINYSSSSINIANEYYEIISLYQKAWVNGQVEIVIAHFAPLGAVTGIGPTPPPTINSFAHSKLEKVNPAHVQGTTLLPAAVYPTAREVASRS
jgi:hypothetical protein